MNDNFEANQEVYFTLKFYKGAHRNGTDDPFKFELDFNYPFTTNDASQKLQQENALIEPGNLKKTMEPFFDQLKLYFELADNIVNNKINDHFPNSKNEVEVISNFEQLKSAFDTLRKIKGNKCIKQISINRISYALFNPKELNISTNFSFNDDIKPPKGSGGQ
ncbi:MAG: hypothetical protein WAZ98_06240 [Cyclobacteriaceae bacterium]